MTTRTTDKASPSAMTTPYCITVDATWGGFPLSQLQRAEIERHISQFVVEEQGASCASTTIGRRLAGH